MTAEQVVATLAGRLGLKFGVGTVGAVCSTCWVRWKRLRWEFAVGSGGYHGLLLTVMGGLVL